MGKELNPVSETNKVLSRRYYEAWNTRNLSIPEEIFSHAFFIHDPASPVPLHQGPEGVKGRIELYHAAFPNLHIAVEDMLAELDKVVTRWTLRGIHQGPFKGLAATHREVAVTGITIHRIAAGKIREAWVNWDTLSLWQQLGVITPP